MNDPSSAFAATAILRQLSTSCARRFIRSTRFASAARDRLAVSGTAHKPDGSQATALTVTGGNVSLPTNKLVVLTGDGAPTIGVAASDLRPGLTADLTLQFSSGAQTKLTVPVVSAADPHYAAAAPELAG